jgi:hypothetical protein
MNCDDRTNCDREARTVIDAHAHSLIVVDEQHRPVAIVSRLDVLAAHAHPAWRAVETA